MAAAGSASRGQQRAADAAAAEQARQYDLTRADQAPYREAGTNALANLVQLSGQYGKVPTAAEVMAQPGYQFGLSQGLDSIENRAAAAGGLYSGAAGKALTQFGNDYATSKFADAFNQKRLAEGDIWNRYSSLAGIGQTATNQLQQAGQNYANNVGQIGMSNANAQGAARIAQGNALQGAINQGVSWYNQRQQPQPSTWYDPNAYNFGNYGGSVASGTGYAGTGGYDFNYADGGPVVKPKGYALGGAVAWGGQNRLQEAVNQPSFTPQTGYAPTMDATVAPEAAAVPKVPAVAVPPGKDVTQQTVAPLGTVAQPAFQPPAEPYPEWKGPEASGMALWEHEQRYGTPAQWAQRQQPQQPAWMGQTQQAFADGGRVEPKVGTKAPVRVGGTGGGLSTNALLALVQAQQSQPVIVPLAGNPLTQPEAILAARLRAAGAYMHGGEVDGPGGPKDDLIPAMLSNGEHVMDTASVNAIGGGSNRKGQQKLNKLRAAVKGGA